MTWTVYIEADGQRVAEFTVPTEAIAVAIMRAVNEDQWLESACWPTP